MMKDSSKSLQKSIEWLRGLSDGVAGNQIEIIPVKGIRQVKAHTGYLLCDFIIPDSLADEIGNWHAGAIAALIDTVGSMPVHSFTSRDSVSIDFSISYYSTVKVQEEVEVEAKVVGDKENLTSVIVEIRKKKNIELIALVKQWMSTTKRNLALHPVSNL
ncbi:hypothetical protein L6164_021521 [Bauhinia variegata]|uniref:Uncharacterized protein n=1 Tax=Bauhinia variegata TaxID=167791 RepID=A0ACB9MYR5_BAUVA|nr:hypothetical protein L6164_021521 [Bauhinia variegata]